MKQITQFFLIGLILLSITVIYDGFFIIEEGQQAMITQFGAPVGEPKTEAGIKFKLPFVQDVNYFDKKIQIWDGDPNQIPTNDKTYVYLDVTARWRITDALKYMQAVKTEARTKSLLDAIINGTVRDTVNKNNLIEIIRSSDWSPDKMTNLKYDDAPPKVGRDGISNLVLDAAAKITPQYGIELLDVMFKRVNYIESVRLKVYDRMISERKRIAAEKRSTGEGKKAEILGKVERELKVILSEANREASEIKGKADASATKIYGDIYGQDPDFFSFYKTLKSYSDVIGKNTSLILSADSDLFHYLQKVDTK